MTAAITSVDDEVDNKNRGEDGVSTPSSGCQNKMRPENGNEEDNGDVDGVRASETEEGNQHQSASAAPPTTPAERYAQSVLESYESDQRQAQQTRIEAKRQALQDERERIKKGKKSSGQSSPTEGGQVGKGPGVWESDRDHRSESSGSYGRGSGQLSSADNERTGSRSDELRFEQEEEEEEDQEKHESSEGSSDEAPQSMEAFLTIMLVRTRDHASLSVCFSTTCPCLPACLLASHFFYRKN